MPKKKLTYKEQDLREWRKLSRRNRAFFPACGKFYMEPQYLVTISLPKTLVDWLMLDVIGNASYVADIEETIISALYCYLDDMGLEEPKADPKTPEEIARSLEVISRVGTKRHITCRVFQDGAFFK